MTESHADLVAPIKPCSNCGGRSYSLDRSGDGILYCDDCNWAMGEQSDGSSEGS